MVLKIIQMSTFEAARWIAALSVISAFIWSVGGFIALTLWSTYRQDIIETAGLATREDVLRVEQRLADAADSFTDLSRQIIVLSRPEHVVLYREPPRPLLGFCVAGQPCGIAVFAERSQRALECQILGARTELLILASGREYVALPTASREATNLTARPRSLEPAFTLPQSIPPGIATAIIRSQYDNCTWQIDGEPPVIQDSPVFDLEIRPAGR